MAKTVSLSSPWQKTPLHSFQIGLVTAVFFRIFRFNPSEFRITTTTCLFYPHGDPRALVLHDVRDSGCGGGLGRWFGPWLVSTGCKPSCLVFDDWPLFHQCLLNVTSLIWSWSTGSHRSLDCYNYYSCVHIIYIHIQVA